MHFYCIARGMGNHITEWVNELRAQYCKLQIRDSKGKYANSYARIQVRKIELYEIVFPATAEAQVMGMINPSEYNVLGKWSKTIKFLAKALGLKKMLPRNKWITPQIPLTRNLSVMPLGTKADVENWTRDESKGKEIHALGLEPQEEL